MLPSPRVLIVDDNLAHASDIKRALRNPLSIVGRLNCEIDVVEDIANARKYLSADSIDLYVLDLEISEVAGEGLLDASVGRAFVQDVLQATNAGVVVCSAIAAETEAAELLETGADDYIEKTSAPDIVAARVLSVWRRTLSSRQTSQQAVKFAHVGRTFIFNDWRFVVGNRTIINSDGTAARLSPTEHAFLRYLCAADNNAIDTETFNIDVLDRDPYKVHVRLDNFVHRLRKKFGGRIELTSQGNGVYKLLDVRELRPDLKS